MDAIPFFVIVFAVIVGRWIVNDKRESPLCDGECRRVCNTRREKVFEFVESLGGRYPWRPIIATLLPTLSWVVFVCVRWSFEFFSGPGVLNELPWGMWLLTGMASFGLALLGTNWICDVLEDMGYGL